MIEAPDIDLSTIPVAQRAVVVALMETIAALQEITRRQQHLIAEMNHALHGKRSEKLAEDARQLAFEDLSIALAEVEAEKETHPAKAGEPTNKPARQRTIGNLPAALPRVEEVIEPDSLICPCGCGILHEIGEDRTERMDIVPAQLRVIVTVRPKYACRSCTDGVTQAPAPSHLIIGGLPTEATLDHVLVNKYADHLPLYRQSQILARAGLDLHRAVLADWVGKAAFHLKPIVDRLAEHLKRSGKLLMDETTAPVLDPGRGVTKTGYLWALARDDTYLARPQEGLRQGPVLVCSPAKAKWRQTGNG
jgi:transposase